jgi:hypothetical protein
VNARKTVVCTGIDATYVGLDSHAWHVVFRGCLESHFRVVLYYLVASTEFQ